MKTKTIPRALSTVSLAKNLAAVTILGFSLGVSVAQSNVAEAAATHAFNLNYDQAQRLANQVYAQTVSRGEVYSYEAAGPHDRVPHLCSEECACFAKKFATAFRSAGFDTKTIQLNAPRNVMFIKARIGAAGHATDVSTAWTYHIVTMVRVGGRWQVVDPLIVQSPKFEAFTDWHQRLESAVDISTLKD